MKVRKQKRLNPNTVLVIRQIIVGILIFGFIGMVVTGIWYGSRASYLTIDSVTVEGGETIPHAEIETMINEKLEGTYLGLVPRRFSPLYPKDEIITEITNVERIKSVKLTRDTGKSLVATFEEYIPDALWCDEDTEFCTFIDKTGHSFTQAPNLTGGSFLRLERTGIKPFIGTQAFTTESYDRINNLVSILAESNWFVAVVEVDAAGDMYLQIVEGGELKVALSDEPISIVDNLLTVLTSPEFVHIQPGNFEYIDLRFGNKVFVSEFKIEEFATSSEDFISE